MDDTAQGAEMTERVTVNAAQTDDGPHMPSWMDEDAVTLSLIHI